MPPKKDSEDKGVTEWSGGTFSSYRKALCEVNSKRNKGLAEQAKLSVHRLP